MGSPEKEEIGGIRGFGCQSVKAALESKQLQNRKLTSEQDIVEPVHYRLRGSMGFEKYKKWAKLDPCFSFNKPTKQEILHFLGWS